MRRLIAIALGGTLLAAGLILPSPARAASRSYYWSHGRRVYYRNGDRLPWWDRQRNRRVRRSRTHWQGRTWVRNGSRNDVDGDGIANWIDRYPWDRHRR